MSYTGSALRAYREDRGLSQARLAEMTGISQHLLSAFELGKSSLPQSALTKLQNTVAGNEDSSVIHRKKRYRQHTYDGRAHDPDRVARCAPSQGNKQYIDDLRSIQSEVKPVFTGLSLFGGCGGLSYGFKSAGCDILGFVEIDDDLSRICAANQSGSVRLGNSIQDLDDATIDDFLVRHGQVDVMIGGPPCQGFSLSGKRKVDDPRNELFKDYVRVLDRVKPRVAILENVRLLTSMKDKSGNLVKESIKSSFEERGYKTGMFEINVKDYGVPQHRERVIFVAVDQALGVEPSIPTPSHGKGPGLFTNACRSFADACSDLSYLESGEADKLDSLHSAVLHPDHVLEWLWDVQQGKSAHDNVDPALRPPSGYNTTYKRQVWVEPGATVQTTFGMISGCRNVHPVATRSLTIREAARLQSFPDDYVFCGSLGTIRMGIGNAVPPLFASRLAWHVRTELLNLVKISSL